MQYHHAYITWKEVMDNMYAGKINEAVAVKKWLSILASSVGFKIRPNHNQEGFSYFVYDKEGYGASGFDKPLGLGMVYTKPNGIKTQDIAMVHPLTGIKVYYKEMDMIKDYPSMKGVHKKNLPL